MKMPNWDGLTSKQLEIVQKLHAYYQVYGRRPMMADLHNRAFCRECDVPHLDTIRKHFASVNEAFRTADIPVVRPERADFVRAIQRFHERHGYMPTSSELVSGEVDYSKAAFLGKRGFRYWSDALKAAGYAKANARRKEPTKEQLVKDLQSFARKLGRIPTPSEVQSNPDLSSDYYYRKILGSSWDEVCQVAQLREILKLPTRRQEMLDYLQMKIDKLGRAPTLIEMRHGQFSVGEYEAEFGSWTAALGELGQKPRKPSRRREPGEAIEYAAD